MIARWTRRFRQKLQTIATYRGQNPFKVFDRYVVSMPSHQNAVDVVRGWNCSFPPEFGIEAGRLASYHDPRIAWMIDKYGSLDGRSLLELGPLEGGHTVMLERAGASVDAVEANQIA